MPELDDEIYWLALSEAIPTLQLLQFDERRTATYTHPHTTGPDRGRLEISAGTRDALLQAVNDGKLTGDEFADGGPPPTRKPTATQVVGTLFTFGLFLLFCGIMVFLAASIFDIVHGEASIPNRVAGVLLVLGVQVLCVCGAVLAWCFPMMVAEQMRQRRAKQIGDV